MQVKMQACAERRGVVSSTRRAAFSHTPPGCAVRRLGRARQQLRRTLVRANFTSSYSYDESDGDDDQSFYNILGVPPTAETREIRKAYLSLMKECHPDLNGDNEGEELCMIVNDIYETLADPDRRALYDNLSGFSADSVNPFLDTSGQFPADRVFVDELSCIGCRNCTNVSCRTFAIEEEHGRARVMRQGIDTEALLQEAIDTCPVNCIHWVTAPQLSLLEVAMKKLDRVAVWALMSGGGDGKDVFLEASIAWEKRKAAARASAQAAQDRQTFAGFWGDFAGASGARMYEEAGRAGSSTDGGDGAVGGGKEGARIANLAAKAARAARQWKNFQEFQQRSRRLQLTVSSSGSSED